MSGWKLSNRWVLTVALTAAVGSCGGEGPVEVVIEPEPITAPGHYIRNFGVDGLPRNFEVYVPPSVDFSQPSPMVLAFHGNPQTAAQMRVVSDLDASADSLGVVIVYPNKANNADWRWGCDTCSIAALNGIDDMAYVDAVLDKMELDMNIDVDRIYVTGFSQGGLMTYRLACTKDSRFAAFAPVGSLMWQWHVDRCDNAARKPIMIIEGTLDTSFDWDGGTGNLGTQLSAHGVRDFFSARNGCAATPTDVPIPDVVDDGTTATKQVFEGCTAETLFYRIDGGGHTWPGSPVDFGPGLGLRSDDFSANDEVLGFFLRHTR